MKKLNKSEVETWMINVMLNASQILTNEEFLEKFNVFIKDFIDTDLIIEDQLFASPELTQLWNKFIVERDGTDIVNYLNENIKVGIDVSESNSRTALAAYSLPNLQSTDYTIESYELGESLSDKNVLSKLALTFSDTEMQEIRSMQGHYISYCMGKVNDRIANAIWIFSKKGFPVRIFTKLGGHSTLFTTNRDEARNTSFIWKLLTCLLHEKKLELSVADVYDLLLNYGFLRDSVNLSNTEVSIEPEFNFDVIQVIRDKFSKELNDIKINYIKDVDGDSLCIVENFNEDGTEEIYVVDFHSVTQFLIPYTLDEVSRYQIFTRLSELTDAANSLTAFESIADCVSKRIAFDVPPMDLLGNEDSSIDTKPEELEVLPDPIPELVVEPLVESLNEELIDKDTTHIVEDLSGIDPVIDPVIDSVTDPVIDPVIDPTPVESNLVQDTSLENKIDYIGKVTHINENLEVKVSDKLNGMATIEFLHPKYSCNFDFQSGYTGSQLFLNIMNYIASYPQVDAKELITNIAIQLSEIGTIIWEEGK